MRFGGGAGESVEVTKVIRTDWLISHSHLQGKKFGYVSVLCMYDSRRDMVSKELWEILIMLKKAPIAEF